MSPFDDYAMKNRVLLLICPFLLIGCTFNRFFYYPSCTVLPQEGFSVHSIRYHNSDKVEYLELRSPSTPIGTLTVLAGNAQNGYDLLPFVKNFVAEGLIVYLINYPGYGKSEGKTNHKTVFASCDQIIKEVLSSSDTINNVLLGFSLGGNLAISLAAINKDKIDGVITEGAFSSHKDIAKHFTPRPFKSIIGIVTKSICLEKRH